MCTQRVFVGLASLAFALAITAQAARAQQDGPAAPGASAPQSQQPSPSTPSAPSPSSPSLGAAQASTTITGELKDVDTKSKTVTVKTVAGPEMKFKWDDSTKIAGSKGAAGLATMTGQQVTISYKKDGQSNMASNIELHNSPTTSPSTPRTPPPGPDPTAPRSPDPTSPRTPGSPDSPTSPESPRP
jgi:hypothetical protein